MALSHVPDLHWPSLKAATGGGEHNGVNLECLLTDSLNSGSPFFKLELSAVSRGGGLNSFLGQVHDPKGSLKLRNCHASLTFAPAM